MRRITRKVRKYGELCNTHCGQDELVGKALCCEIILLSDIQTELEQLWAWRDQDVQNRGPG